jgi:urease subunit gamma
MQLTPRGRALLVFTAAELARRRLEQGHSTSHLDAVALASDTVAEEARRGKSHEEARSSVHGLCAASNSCQGVPELLEAPPRWRPSSATAAGSFRSSGSSLDEAGRDPARRRRLCRGGASEPAGDDPDPEHRPLPGLRRLALSARPREQRLSTSPGGPEGARLTCPRATARIDPGGEVELSVVVDQTATPTPPSTGRPRRPRPARRYGPDRGGGGRRHGPGHEPLVGFGKTVRRGSSRPGGSRRTRRSTRQSRTS